ncbi:type II toxin-antitoxin system RelE/ParE family toxin [Billgrantia gudaonensis]|uniref:type II toxin-antitoxin system RelE/ParE family toxin n=1 Tax=Billgrantia gudaonensis TaxID=376427 RepID=UPI001FDF002B|nr:type II toxin-antitoxin system RelE/ParE family toxin [Halomonas gudaonensis]
MLDIKQTDTYRKWERKLRDQRAKALIAACVFRLANGLPGDVKPVGQGVSELRIHHGPGYRVYFKQRGDEILILPCVVAIKAPSTAISRLHSAWQHSGRYHER